MTTTTVGVPRGPAIRLGFDEPTPKKETKVSSTKSSSSVSAGIGIGSALAIAISWSVNHSILWAILHGVCSWFYVIYYAIVR